MKQFISAILVIIFSANVSSQESNVFVIKGSGYKFPIVNVTTISSGQLIELDIESFNYHEVDVNGVIADKITFPEGVNVSEKGLPDIQHFTASIAISASGKTSLNILESEYTDYPHFIIAPSTGDPGLYNIDNEKFITDSLVFSSDAFYPDHMVKADNPYLWGDTRGQVIRFYPVQYNPVQNILRVYHHIKVELVTTTEPGVNELKSVGFNSGSGLPVQRVMDSHFDNPVSASRYMAVEEKGSMLIVSHPDFINGLQEFKEWKLQKGIKCEIVDVTTLVTPLKIKEYITKYYYTKGLTYLILVGDARFVPTNETKNGPSDNVYGYIAGDDHYPEILIGRFPCETVKQLETMVTRTINYEKSPAVTENYSDLLGIASGLGPGDDNEMDFEHVRGITGALKTSGYRNAIELFDGSRGGNDLSGDPTLSMTAKAINTGVGVIMYIGHGGINGWTTSGFSTTDIRNLVNTTTQPFIWSAGCSSGDFTSISCFGEEWLKAESDGKPTGAIATLMSSANQSWYPPMEAQDEITKILAYNKSSNTTSTFGGISLSGCMKMNDKYGEGAYKVTDTWILFGDPSVEMRTSKPVAYMPIHDSIIGSDFDIIEITGIDSTAFVCISNGNQILASDRATGSELDVILTDLSSNTQLLLTITGINHIPYTAIIKVSDLPAVAYNTSPANNMRLVSTKVPLNWQLKDGSKPDFYTVCHKEASSLIWKTVIVMPGSDPVIPGLEYNTQYEWKVISHNSKGTSESKIFNFTTIHKPDEDFEHEDFMRSNWDNINDWYVDNTQSYEGKYSLHSGNTTSSGNSSLFFECQTLTCDYISFWIKMNGSNDNASVSFYIDSIFIVDWNTTMPWTNEVYRVDPGFHRFEWRFTSKNDITTSTSEVWIDNIYLPLHKPVSVTKTSQLACAAKQINIEPNVSGYASLKWETAGSGYFNDVTSANPVYFPSDQDLQGESVKLNLVINVNQTCESQDHQYELVLADIPILPVINDTTLFSDEQLVLNMIDESSAYLLYENDTLPSSLNIEASKLLPGKNMITLVAENSFGCSLTKQFTVTVINQQKPGTGTLTLYPNPASEEISLKDSSNELPLIVTLLSMDGRVLEQYDYQGISSNKLSIGHLKPGMYLLRSESKKSVTSARFVKI